MITGENRLARETRDAGEKKRDTQKPTGPTLRTARSPYPPQHTHTQQTPTHPHRDARTRRTDNKSRKQDQKREANSGQFNRTRRIRQRVND